MEWSGSKVGYTSPICTNRLIFGKWTFFTWFFLDIDMNCKGLQKNMPQLVGSKEHLISKNIQTSLDPMFCGIFVCCPLQFMPIYFMFWGRRSILFYRSDMLYILHGLSRHVRNVGFVRPISSFRDINATLWLLPSWKHVIWRDSVYARVQCEGLNHSERLIFSRISPFVTPSWRATIMAKQLSTATAALCFGFFRCRVVRSALQISMSSFWRCQPIP